MLLLALQLIRKTPILAAKSSVKARWTTTKKVLVRLNDQSQSAKSLREERCLSGRRLFTRTWQVGCLMATENKRPYSHTTGTLKCVSLSAMLQAFTPKTLSQAGWESNQAYLTGEVTLLRKVRPLQKLPIHWALSKVTQAVLMPL